MKPFRNFAMLLLALCYLPAMAGAAGAPERNAQGGRTVLATVNGEPIRLEDYLADMASMHQGAREGDVSAERNYLELLQRLVDTQLIIQEARYIGLNDLQEVRNAVDAYSRETMRKLLLRDRIIGLKPDPKRERQIYEQATREYKIASALFVKEADAAKAASEIAGGAPFDNVIGAAIADGKAKGETQGAYVRENTLLPEVVKTLKKMKKGAVSPVLKVGNGFALVRLEGVRRVDSPDAKAQAAGEALREKRVAAMSRYVEGLKKKYVRIRKNTLDGLDYEAEKPGFEALLKDKRVVATVQGESPITVGELTEALAGKFYHGVDRAIREKKVNAAKMDVLNDMLYKRVLEKEARARKIDATAEYKQRVRRFGDAVIFGTFVQKVISQDVAVDNSEVRAYYDDHRADFSTPEMVRMDGLIYARQPDAEDAIAKLRSGADFNWVRANSSGQVNPDNVATPLRFSGPILVVKAGLPEDVRKAVSGAKAGDYRLFAPADGPYYVLYIVDLIAPQPQPYAEAAPAIRKKLVAAKEKSAVEEWTRKLRAASEVRVLVTEDQLKAMVQQQVK